MKKRKGFYSISVVAKMFGVHQQTIRMYEKEGLIAPKRTEGNTRLFSEEDVDRLEEIINLTHKMGVNLAGVEIILKLQKKMQKMQQDMNKLFEQTAGEMEQEKEILKTDIKKNVEQLAKIKSDSSVLTRIVESRVHESERSTSALKQKSKKQERIRPKEVNTEIEGWEIDYDDN